MKQKGLIIFFVLVLAGGAVAYWMYAKKTPDLTQSRPDETMAATALAAAFEEDAAAADKRFGGKIIQVVGRVGAVNAAGAVVLKSEDGNSDVVVGLDPRHLEDAGKMQVGNQVVVQGLYSGYEASGAADDLLAGLGITVHLRSGGLVRKQ